MVYSFLIHQSTFIENDSKIDSDLNEIKVSADGSVYSKYKDE